MHERVWERVWERIRSVREWGMETRTYVDILALHVGILVLTVNVVFANNLDIVGREPALAAIAVASPPPGFQLGQDLNHIILFETQVRGIL